MAVSVRVFRHIGDDPRPLYENEAHCFAMKFALSIFNLNAIYTFIPNNACSTMRYTVAAQNGFIKCPSQFSWIHDNNETYAANLAELARAKYTFTILRDPYIRLASCFLDKIVHNINAAHTFSCRMGSGFDISKVTFRQFVEGVSRFKNDDVHWCPQLSFLVYEKYDRYFCVEEFSDAVRHLRRIGLTVLDARGLTRHGSDQYRRLDGPGSFADMPASEILSIKQSGFIPRYDQMYDVELARVVRHAYDGDFDLYNSAIGRKSLTHIY